jgi:hypothetical protein
MVQFTGYCLLSRYIPHNLWPKGVNNRLLATSKGLILGSKLYQGTTTPVPESDLRLGPFIILCLVENLLLMKRGDTKDFCRDYGKLV